MIFVVLPALNEEIALPRLVKKFDLEFTRSGKTYKIIVLDDGSTDRTAETAQALSGRYPVELLRHKTNLGLGPTMRDGLLHCAKIASPNDLIVTLDCDDTHEPKYVHLAIGKIEEGYDVVVLSRYQKGGGEKGLSWTKSFLSRGAGLFLKLFFPIRGVREYSCGYRVFRAASIQKAIQVFGEDFIKFAHLGFTVTPEVLIKLRMLGCRITEVPFILSYDQKPGPSKNKPLKTIMGYFALVFLYWGRRK